MCNKYCFQVTNTRIFLKLLLTGCKMKSTLFLYYVYSNGRNEFNIFTDFCSFRWDYFYSIYLSIYLFYSSWFDSMSCNDEKLSEQKVILKEWMLHCKSLNFIYCIVAWLYDVLCVNWKHFKNMQNFVFKNRLISHLHFTLILF